MIETYLPWVLSLLTIFMTVMAGDKHRDTWLIGLFNQSLWLIWILATENWGFVPLNASLWFIYYRNHFKWRVCDGRVE